MKPHIPQVVITTPRPNRAGITEAIFSTVMVDGEEWAIVSYKIDGRVEGIQHLTLEILADVIVRHAE